MLPYTSNSEGQSIAIGQAPLRFSFVKTASAKLTKQFVNWERSTCTCTCRGCLDKRKSQRCLSNSLHVDHGDMVKDNHPHLYTQWATPTTTVTQRRSINVSMLKHMHLAPQKFLHNCGKATPTPTVHIMYMYISIVAGLGC